ncbi:threonine-phosphate decarboxylase CobD [Bacillus xiapuensis]|uniref:threonine-phosphate decarboxylase CobD n=1 Tax=Bacillus xiapuensis TaxID=2014075 RepID=UPI000C24BDBC|nr:threonine-phosphate decarboxylase CobD [Bacillus xiapuensis]
MNLPAHGSNPHYLYETMNLAQPKNVIDFSVNTNPYGPPDELKRKWPEWLAYAADYPDPFGTALTRLLAVQNQVTEKQVLLGNGAAELIQILGQHLQGKKAVIVQPAFSEYERVCKAYGCEVIHIRVDENEGRLPVDELAQAAEAADALFLCNPNNPTGLVFARQDISALLKRLAASETLTIIDEAFYDFAGEDSYADSLNHYPQLIILRSLTKMYAIAGLRIGYMLASPSLIARMARFRPHWNINAIALAAAETIVTNASFVKHSRKLIQQERLQMFEFLEKEGFRYTKSSVNFYLLRDPQIHDQRPLLAFLLTKGLVLRHTYNYPTLGGTWLRAAVRTPTENQVLKEALKQWRTKS